WSDVYGVGATLYRCITGRDPLDALERDRTFEQSTIDPLTPATMLERPHFAPHIRVAVAAALKLDPLERPAAARALQDRLTGKEPRDERAKPWAGYGRGAGF